LSFVVSAGWVPGLSELLPVYDHARARVRIDTIESLTVYFGDSGEWSTAAFQDMAWFLRRIALRRPGYFRKGERIPVKMHQASTLVDLGGRVGRCRFSLYSIPEQNEVGRRLTDGEVFIYSYLPGLRVALTAALVASLPLPNGLSVRLLQSAFRRTSLPVCGFVVARVLGRSQGRRLALTAEIIYDRHRDYWINGLAAATGSMPRCLRVPARCRAPPPSSLPRRCHRTASWPVPRPPGGAPARTGYCRLTDTHAPDTASARLNSTGGAS
jgi:hypothetical protein